MVDPSASTAPDLGGTDPDELTIDQLAAAVGMTVRNVRAHQARGLLPPPTLRGRVGYYGRSHRRRLEQIREMQDEGLNLAAIAKLLDDGQLTSIASEAFGGATPATFAPEELAGRLGLSLDDEVVARALAMGLIEIDGALVRMDVPGLVPVAEEFVALGVPLSAQLDALGQVLASTEEVAASYLRLADEHLVARLAVDSQGDPEAIRAAVARLRDLARLALDVAFDRAMSAALREWFEQGEPEAP